MNNRSNSKCIVLTTTEHWSVSEWSLTTVNDIRISFLLPHLSFLSMALLPLLKWLNKANVIKTFQIDTRSRPDVEWTIYTLYLSGRSSAVNDIICTVMQLQSMQINLVFVLHSRFRVIPSQIVHVFLNESDTESKVSKTSSRLKWKMNHRHLFSDSRVPAVGANVISNFGPWIFS